MKWILIFLGLIILVGIGCKDNWSGFYYPDGCLSCENRYIIQRNFSSLDECRAWANRVKMSRRYNSEDDYECGKNCKKSEKFGGEICDETLK